MLKFRYLSHSFKKNLHTFLKIFLNICEYVKYAERYVFTMTNLINVFKYYHNSTNNTLYALWSYF